jgi:hypothetical protein
MSRENKPCILPLIRLTGHSGVALLAAFFASCRPQSLDLEEYEEIVTWLACDECTAGERDSVFAIGPDAVPYLAGVLDSVPPQILTPLRNRLANSWTVEIAADSAEYVNFFLENARRKARVRAVRSLGDFNAERHLREALGTAVARGYGDAVISAIRSELDEARDSTTATAAVRLSPTQHNMRVGQSSFLAVFVEDRQGNLQRPVVQWTTSAPAVVSVAANGRLTALAMGTAVITARSQVNPSISASATVTVTPPDPAPHIVAILEGNQQTQIAGSTLPIVLRISVVTTSGLAVSGQAVTWRVLQGGGTVTPISIGSGPAGTTNASGVAGAQYQLGPAGPQRIEALIPGSPPVVFRATAN